MALLGAAGQESSARSVLKYLPDALVGLGRALKVLVGTDLLADLLTLHVGKHTWLAFDDADDGRASEVVSI